MVARATDPRDPDSAQRKHPKWLPESGEIAEVCEAIALQINARAYAEHRQRLEELQREQERLQRLEYMRHRPEVEKKIAEWRASVGTVEKPKGWDLGWRGLSGLAASIVGSEMNSRDQEA